jgi:glycerol-3-phosphate dehydrogenase (NAD(P)+)
MTKPTLGVIGAGAWGAALAIAGVAAGSDVRLWARDPATAERLRTTRRNERYLPGVDLPDSLDVTGDLAAMADGRPLLLAAPSAYLSGILSRLIPLLPPDAGLVLCAKGFDAATGRAALDILTDAAGPRPVGLLSGPSFAADVARGLPAAVTLASRDAGLIALIQQRLGQPRFRIYPTDDMIGVEIGGAVKNVLAIACGVADGRGFGDSARAALITRGLAEIMRLGLALGARQETLAGLSGLGDLVLTCTSGQSRNYALGLALGQGRSLADASAAGRGVAEGVPSAAALADLARARDVEMPIVEAVNAVLHRGARVEDAIAGLLARPFPIAEPGAITLKSPGAREADR